MSIAFSPGTAAAPVPETVITEPVSVGSDKAWQDESGNVLGEGNTLQVQMDVDRSVTAVYAAGTVLQLR